MITPTPTTASCSLRFFDDISGTDEILDLDRDQGEVLRQLIFMVNEINKSQGIIRACLHLTREKMAIHIWSVEEDFIREIGGAESVLLRVVEMLQTGEERWVP